jgi:Domain of unknown function (DUF4386)
MDTMSVVKAKARRAGILYVVMSVMGVPVLLYLPGFIVQGDAAATAHNILNAGQVYRLLLLADLVASILFLVLGWWLYQLFEAVDRKQATLMMLFVLASACIGILDVAFLSAPVVFLSGPPFSSAFTQPQLEALAYGLLKVRGFELSANEALWGLWLVPFGILVIKSEFIPKVIGVLLLVASVGYVAMSVAFIAFPQYKHAVASVGMWLIQGELSVILWLVIMGARSRGTAGVIAARGRLHPDAHIIEGPQRGR